MNTPGSIKYCERCGKEHDGSFGSGRFCSSFCAHARRQTAQTRQRISESTKETCQRRGRNEEAIRKFQNTMQTKRAKRSVVIAGDVLDITYGKLDEYRDSHPVCEICGQKNYNVQYGKPDQPIKLATDHDHKTGKFRGLLCSDCNRKLEWSIMFKEQIDKYLSTPPLDR